MSTISIHIPEFLRLSFNGGSGNHPKLHRIKASCTMNMDSNPSPTRRMEEISIQHHHDPPLTPQSESFATHDLRFDKMQPSDREFIHKDRFEFGNFVAREAVLDEEYWTAAWLRAESHWEDRANERYIDSHKRKFAEQEFNAIKRRRGGQHVEMCTCIVAVKKEQKNKKRAVIKSVVGTLDLSIRHLLQGENFPGERVKAHLFCRVKRTGQSRYGYIANLCVAKSARRRGIASNMLLFAIDSAKSSGVELVYVHVHRNNSAAQELYEKIGFEMVDEASLQLLEEQTYLLCLKTQKFSSAHCIDSFLFFRCSDKRSRGGEGGTKKTPTTTTVVL